MEKFIKSLRTGVCVLLLANSFCLTAYAAPQENVRDGKEPEPDAMGVIPQKIIHRIAPPQPRSVLLEQANRSGKPTPSPRVRPAATRTRSSTTAGL